MINITKVEDIQLWITEAEGIFCCAQDYVQKRTIYMPEGEKDHVVFKIAWRGSDDKNPDVENEICFTEQELSDAQVVNYRILYITKEDRVYFFELFKHTPILAPIR